MEKTVRKHGIDMLHGSIWNKLPLFALPVAATAILEQLFNASDIAVVGNFTGAARTLAVAAVGANNSIIGLIVNVFIGIALGANVVIANAGVINFGYTWEMTDAQVEKVINIDLIGTWRTDKYAALYMRKQGFGRIINISSTSGMYGTPKLATYCMAKWGVRGLTKTLAQELKGTGIVVNTVCPTKVKTPMCETESYVKFINDLTGKDFKNWQEMYEGVPFLEVEDISDMVYWLGTSLSAGKFSGRDLGLDLGTLQQ